MRPHLRPARHGRKISDSRLLQPRHPGGHHLGLKTKLERQERPACATAWKTRRNLNEDRLAACSRPATILNRTICSIETFPIPHDAQDPVGFSAAHTGGNIGFATDLGHMTKLVLERIRAANVLVLESNHDVKMLQECPRRSWSLKQRILGRHGHLSNVAAAEAAAQIMSAGSATSLPGAPEPRMQQAGTGGKSHGRATASNRRHPRPFQIAAQDAPCATLEL